MRLFLVLFFFSLLYGCESTKIHNDIKKNKKNQSIQMEVTTEPSIKIKK